MAYKKGTKFIRFAVTDEERATLERRRAGSGKRSIAIYCHDIIFDGKINKKTK